MINLEFKLNQKGGTLFFVRIENVDRPIVIDHSLESNANSVILKLSEMGYNIDYLEVVNSSGVKTIIPDNGILHEYGLKKEGYLNGIVSVKIPIKTRLIDATFEGNAEEVELILREAGDLSINLIMETRNVDDHEKTLIHYAARKGLFNILTLFKRVIGDENFKQLVNVLDNEERSPLMMACRGTFLYSEDSLINTITLLFSNMNDEQKNARDINGNSALKFAINSSVSNNLASVIYSSVTPTLHDFTSQFYNIGRGIDILIDQYSLSKSFLLDKYMIDLLGINWNLLKQRVKEI